MIKLQFILYNYALLGVFICSCFGLSARLVRRLFNTNIVKVDRPFTIALTICFGIGIHVVGLQILGIFGLLNKFYVSGFLLLGLIGFAGNFIWQLNSHHQSFDAKIHLTETNKLHWFFPVLLTLLAIELSTRPLHPPIAWDELMYHLPHARDWAAAGKLTVNEWLRYPLFPYNFNLLYAESLLFENDILPHMIHAFAGWLVAFGAYRLASVYFDRVIASITVLLFVILALGQFSNAYIDLGLTLFIFFGLSCVFFWVETKNDVFIYLAMFLIGVASGIKYQALIVTPFLAVVILIRERRPLRLLYLFLIFLLPCIYWYIRNYLISGDPIHPLGARFFGYWGWNASDMALQLADIKRVADWPNWCIWPSAGALLLRSKIRSFPFRSALLISIYYFIVWLATSHYSRYLLPVYPFIAMLTAVVIRHIYGKLTSKLKLDNNPSKAHKLTLTQNILAVLLLSIFCAAIIPSFGKHWKEIQTNSESRSSYLRNQISSFEVAEFLKQHAQYRIVQIGLESDLFYLPPNTIGDVFGPGRYSNFTNISAAELSSRIHNLGANALLLSNSPDNIDAKKIKQTNEFLNYFSLVKSTAGAELYELKAGI